MIRFAVFRLAWFRWGFALVAALCAFAAQPPGQNAVRVFREAEGLPQLAIYALAADREGRLWAGTLAGVARFDGQRWRTLEAPASAYALMVNSNAMTGLADGSMWIGTRFQGILAWRDGAWTVHDTRSGLPSDNVNAILESRERDRAGRPVIYAATYGKGLARYRDGAWSRVPGGLEDARMFCLLERDGQVWVGTAQGVWILEAGRWRPFQGNHELGDSTVRALAETVDAGGVRSLYIGTEKGGLYRWRDGRLETLPLKQRTGCVNVRALLAGPGDALWVAVSGGGIAHIQGDRWEVLGTGTGLASDFIRCLARTPGGPGGSALWAGSDGDGIYRLHPGGWHRLTVPWPLRDQRVQTFAETRDPATGDPVLWFGHTFLARLQGTRWTFYRPDPENTGEYMRSLVVFPGEQDLWFGLHQSLVRFSQGRFRFFGAREGLAAGQVRTLVGGRDDQGRKLLWIGTSRGVVRYDFKTFTPLPAPPGDPEPSVRALALDGPRLWVGTDRTLACYEGGRWVQPAALRAFRAVGVNTLLVSVAPSLLDPSGLLVGTFGSGVHCLEDVERTAPAHAFSRANTPALRHDLINDLVQDGQGRFYVAGPQGVARCDPANGWTWDNFTQEDGLPGLECLKGSLWRDSAGRIWVGTGSGPAWFDPSTNPPDRDAKALVWESAWAQGRPMVAGADLAPGTQGFRFEFRLLAGHREQDCLYRARLVGLQDAPGDWTPQPFAEFASLPAGPYELQVWAKDYAGNLSGPIRFPFKVRSALWVRPWAWALYALALGGAGYGLLALRTRFLAERNRDLEARIRAATEELDRQRKDQEQLNRELIALNLEKNQFMGIAAHDLRNPLNTIVLIADGLVTGDLETCPPEVATWVAKVAASAHQMTALINEFLDVNALDSGRRNASPRPVFLQDLLPAVASFHQMKMAAKGQALTCLGAESEAKVLADPNHLRQILDNLLSNASKFSPPGARIRLQAWPGARVTRFEVADQGPGLRDEDRDKLFLRFAKLSARPTGGESSTGLGLSIVKHLLDANHGSIWAENRPEGGCSFWVELPNAPEA